jgi:hypothetical protein
MHKRTGQTPTPGSPDGLAEQLERGEVVYYPTCPFPLPEGDDRRFLLEQQLGGRVHKNVSYDPATGRASGFRRESPAQAERLRGLLADWARTTTAWLASLLPRYAACWQCDRVSFRPQEEANRRLRLKARNDLLHVDSFPTRPTGGARILRAFANVNPTEPRIWITSYPFAELLRRYGTEATLPTGVGLSWAQRLGLSMVKVFRPGRKEPSEYDTFMLRFHNYLKANHGFQRGPARRWEFPPGSAWVVMTDTASHAVLRGRYALEHSYFVPLEAMALPQESPAALLARACGADVLRRAA